MKFRFPLPSIFCLFAAAAMASARGTGADCGCAVAGTDPEEAAGKRCESFDVEVSPILACDTVLAEGESGTRSIHVDVDPGAEPPRTASAHFELRCAHGAVLPWDASVKLRSEEAHV